MNLPLITAPVDTVTSDQMAEVDRLATDAYGIDLLQMMELAGRALARLTQSLADEPGAAVTVVVGGGGNGGGAMVAARRLAALRFRVHLVTDRDPERLTGAGAHQAAALRAIGLRPSTAVPPTPGSVIVDGLIGYGLTAAASGRAAELITWINESSATTISLDVPSGIDATSGDSPGPSVRADTTLTLALPKSGLTACKAAGRLLLADIAIPPALWQSHFAIETSRLFIDGDVVDLSLAPLLPPRG
jgi:NAD(P)H-hydrate epimerase